MMHNGDGFYWGGIHMFWWLLIILCFFAMLGWFSWSRKRK